MLNDSTRGSFQRDRLHQVCIAPFGWYQIQVKSIQTKVLTVSRFGSVRTCQHLLVMWLLSFEPLQADWNSLDSADHGHWKLLTPLVSVCQPNSQLGFVRMPNPLISSNQFMLFLSHWQHLNKLAETLAWQDARVARGWGLKQSGYQDIVWRSERSSLLPFGLWLNKIAIRHPSFWWDRKSETIQKPARPSLKCKYCN